MPKKSLGQNFLASPSVARRIAGAASLRRTDTVIEVGPGKGILTRELLGCAGRVIAIEKDEALAYEIERTFPREVRAQRLIVYADDALEVPPAGLGLASGGYSVVANIPYYITGALIRHYLTATAQPKTMVLLVQKEVATQIARAPKESILSLSVKAYGTPQYLGTIRAECFRPRPRVDSAILRITGIDRTLFTDLSEAWFFDVVRAGFAHKRKLAARNLEALAEPANIAAAFARADLKETVRPEDITLSQWATLARVLA